MKKIFLSFMLLGICASIFGTKKSFFAPDKNDKTENTNTNTDNPAQDIPSACRSTFYMANHLYQVTRSSSPELQVPASSTPIAIPDQTHRRTPSLPECLIENRKSLEETDSPVNTTSRLILHSPHSETASVLSVRSTPSSTGSSPIANDLSILAKESALSSFKEAGLEAEKERAFMALFMAKFNDSLAKRSSQHAAFSSSSQ